MTINDNLFGLISIEEDVVQDIINTKPFQRLKEINQYGGVNFVYPDRFQVSRYDHSVGVYFVLKAIGADMETQINGLLHDVGHTAFSHMYDMALSTYTEDNHEQSLTSLEGWQEIENILKNNDLHLKNPDDYTLIKKSLPDIGADRFDYALRDYYASTNENPILPLTLLGNVVIDEEGMLFKDLESAKQFAELGNKAMWYVIYEPSVAVVYQSVAEMIRLGLDKHWFTKDDFLKTDKYILDILKQHKQDIPEKNIRIFIDKFRVEESDEHQYDFKHVKLKSRYFDPRVKSGNKNYRVSELDQNFAKDLNKYIEVFEKAKKGIYYKIIFE